MRCTALPDQMQAILAVQCQLHALVIAGRIAASDGPIPSGAINRQLREKHIGDASSLRRSELRAIGAEESTVGVTAGDDQGVGNRRHLGGVARQHHQIGRIIRTTATDAVCPAPRTLRIDACDVAIAIAARVDLRATHPDLSVERARDVDIVGSIQGHAIDGIDQQAASAAGPLHAPGRIQPCNENILQAGCVEGEITERGFTTEVTGDEQVAVVCRQRLRDVAVRHALRPGRMGIMRRSKHAAQKQAACQRQRGEMDWTRENHDLSPAHWFNTVTVEARRRRKVPDVKMELRCKPVMDSAKVPPSTDSPQPGVLPPCGSSSVKANCMLRTTR